LDWKVNDRERLRQEMSPEDRSSWLLLRVSFWIGYSAVPIGSVLGLFVAEQLWAVAIIGAMLCVFVTWAEQSLMLETERRLEDHVEAD
jgi:hypothetical protein